MSDAQSALREIQNWMRPASMESLVRALSELYLTTARAGEGSEDRKAVVALYARKLRDYPADIALDAVTHCRSKFFPAFEELREAVLTDKRFAVRRQKMRALELFVNGEPVSEHKPPTEEQIARMRAHFGGDQPKERTEPDPFWTEERQAAFRKRYGLKNPAA